MKQPDANKALLLLVQLYMFRKPSWESQWWQHSHATLIRPARFLVFYKSCWNLLFTGSAKAFCSDFKGRPSALLAGICLCSSSSIRGGWTITRSWGRMPNQHDQGFQQRKASVLSQTGFRRMTSECPENTDLYITSATCHAYFSDQLESINWYIF